MQQKIIIGVGNIYRHDDGFGPAVIKMLQTKAIANYDLLDGGTDGLALLDVIAKYEKAIIIDAVHMSAPPGTVKIFTPEEALIKIKSDVLSTHGFGIAEVIKLAEELNIKTEIVIVGIEPEDISFGEGLSKVVTAKLPEVVAWIQGVDSGVRHR